MLTVLVIRGVTLTGATEGIKYFVTPDFEKLKNPDVSCVIKATQANLFGTGQTHLGASPADYL